MVSKTCRRYTYANQPKDTWLVILTLATRWGFDSMRELAVRQLEGLTLGPIDKIALYKEHRIDGRLLIPSYIELCKSPTLPSPVDGQRLSMETVLRLAAARERALLRALGRGVVTPTSADVGDHELDSSKRTIELGHNTKHTRRCELTWSLSEMRALHVESEKNSKATFAFPFPVELITHMLPEFRWTWISRIPPLDCPNLDAHVDISRDS